MYKLISENNIDSLIAETNVHMSTGWILAGDLSHTQTSYEGEYQTYNKHTYVQPVKSLEEFKGIKTQFIEKSIKNATVRLLVSKDWGEFELRKALGKYFDEHDETSESKINQVLLNASKNINKSHLEKLAIEEDIQNRTIECGSNAVIISLIGGLVVFLLLAMLS